MFSVDSEMEQLSQSMFVRAKQAFLLDLIGIKYLTFRQAEVIENNGLRYQFYFRDIQS